LWKLIKNWLFRRFTNDDTTPNGEYQVQNRKVFGAVSPTIK
jgi:hypothetical protein